MLRKLTIVAVCVSSLVSASERQTKIAAKHLLATSQGYNVTHDKTGFRVNGQRVHTYDLDPSLRSVTSNRSLKELFKSDRTKLAVSKVGMDYALKRHDQLRGGGAGGAWLGSWLGYGGVMAASKVVTGLIVWPIAVACPPAGIAVAAVLETVVPVVVQPIALTAGVAGGIALGTATGPV